MHNTLIQWPTHLIVTLHSNRLFIFSTKWF